MAKMYCGVAQAARPAPAGSPWTPSSRDVPPSVAQSWSGGHAQQQHPHQSQHVDAPTPLAVLRTEHAASSPRAGGQSVQSPHGAGQPFYLPQPQQQWQPPPRMAHLQTQQQYPSPAGFHPPFAGQRFDGPGGPFAMPGLGPQHGFNAGYPMMDFQRQASLQGSQGPWPHVPQQPVSPQMRAGLPHHPGFFSPVPAAHPQQQHQGAFGHDASPGPPQQPPHGVFGHVPPPGWQPTRPSSVPGIAGPPPPTASAQAPQQPAPVHNAPQHAPQQQPQHLLRGADRAGSAGSSGCQPPAPLAGSESGKLLLSMLQRNASAGSARSTASAPSMQSTPSAAGPTAAGDSAGATPAPSIGPDAPSAAHAAARAAMGGRGGGRQRSQQGRGSPAEQAAGLHAGRQGGGRGGAQPGRAPAGRGGGAGDAGRRGGGPGRHAPKVVPI